MTRVSQNIRAHEIRPGDLFPVATGGSSKVVIKDHSRPGLIQVYTKSGEVVRMGSMTKVRVWR